MSYNVVDCNFWGERKHELVNRVIKKPRLVGVY